MGLWPTELQWNWGGPRPDFSPTRQISLKFHVLRAPDKFHNEFHETYTWANSTVVKGVTKTKRGMLAARASAPVACRRSLHGQCRCPTGTALTSPIKPAPPTASPSTPAPDTRAAQLARAETTHSLDCVQPAYQVLAAPDWFARSPHSPTCTECGRVAIQCMACAGRYRNATELHALTAVRSGRR